MFVPNHLHLLVKGYINNPPQSETVLNQWFKELVNKVVDIPVILYKLDQKITKTNSLSILVNLFLY
jgi:dihydrodipicolinate synthase/N-acetylneuraminate lyase